MSITFARGRHMVALVLLALAGLVPRTAIAEVDHSADAASSAPTFPRVAQKDRAPTKDAAVNEEHPFPMHFKAPSFDGGVEWINTAGPVDLKLLRGRFVVLDFWTYCCINCMHILPELKKLEHAYPNEIVVIGVHSAKFETEQDSKNIREAVERYEIEHPVVNDARHVIWDKYEVQSWPTLCVIDPEGNLIARNSGEIDFATLDKFFKQAIPYYQQKGLLKPEAPLPTGLKAGYQAQPTPLRFPGKVLADEKSDRLFIADSNHNRIVVAKLDGTLIDVIGSGAIGANDGGYQQATFDHPQGMAISGDTLYVADTENHLVRKVDLKKNQVSTIAGTGKQGHGWPGMEEFAAKLGTLTKHKWIGPPLKTGISSPWALWVQGHDLYIAMAGSHQIWKMSLAPGGEIGPFAGNGREDIVDGPHLPAQPYEKGFCSFAQPSGLSSDGKNLFVADSEGSSIRAVPFDATKNVETIVGTAWMPAGRLFSFADVDGQGEVVRLQHALGVAYHDRLVYVADTYNNKIKVVDPRRVTCLTIAGTGQAGNADDPATFDEPAGLSYARGKLYVADTNNHAIRTVDLGQHHQVATLEIKGLQPPEQSKEQPEPGFPGAEHVDLAAAQVKAAKGKLRLHVDLKLPNGYKINPIAPLRYRVDADEATGPIGRDALGKLTDVPGKSPAFDIDLPASTGTGNEKVKVSLAFYYCQEGGEGVCKAGSVVWNLPLELSPNAAASSVQLPFKVR
ncbi:MAG TPA: thioredoxin-like domain-containing protein [Pirellulales bacterium]|nr:thioredoxin-like domain-containing protein [Pirellulales bacterium]